MPQTIAEPARPRERLLVTTLALGFGLVGLDRFIINPLFPVIAHDLGLGYGDIGMVSAALALTWGIAAVSMGRLTDRVGVKTVLIPAVLAFSLLVGLTGAATGLASLLLLRGLMGLAEGTFVPACIVAATRASRPPRIGLTIGLLHMAAGLFGPALTPVMATRLLQVLPSWHWVFAVAALPGVFVAFGMMRALPPDTPRQDTTRADHVSWRLVLRHKGVITNATLMCCCLSNMTTLAALLPNYLTDHLRFGFERMGIVLSLHGLGALVGLALVPGLGDRFGHKRVAIAAATLQVAGLTAFRFTSADTPALVALLFLIGLASSGVMAITVGPLTGNIVPRHLAATATGIVVGSGEIVGGAVAPALAGWLATAWGIVIVPAFALGAAAIGLLLLAFHVSDTRAPHAQLAVG